MTRVRKYFADVGGDYEIWHNLTAWCFLQFGLPGREPAEWHYTTEADWMDFYFRDAESAELFILKWM